MICGPRGNRGPDLPMRDNKRFMYCVSEKGTPQKGLRTEMRDRPTMAFFLALTLAMTIVATAFWQTAPKRPFFYDEADYMYAGTRGFFSNYLDRLSIPLVQFVRKGLELARDRSQRANMSQFIRASGDITFYRHYHGPAYAYWIALCTKLGVRTASTYRASV